MMTCRELTDFLSDYLDGALPSAVMETFETHLRVCRPCVHYVDSYRTTVTLARSLGTPDPCSDTTVEWEEMPEPLVQAILDAREADGDGGGGDGGDGKLDS